VELFGVEEMTKRTFVKRQSILVLAMVVLLVLRGLVQPCRADLYGSEVNGGDLYRINPYDGSCEIVTHSLVHSTAGLAYNSSDGYLYGSEVNGGDLYRIDPYDGSCEIVTHSLIHSTAGLAYNSSDGYLYGSEVSGGTLYRIDPYDGSCEIVTHSLIHSTAGLAYTPEPSPIADAGPDQIVYAGTEVTLMVQVQLTLTVIH